MAQWGQYQQPILAQLNSVQDDDNLQKTPKERGLFEGQKHWNQDPNSVPTPLVSYNGYMTSTQAKYAANGTSDLAKEP